MTATVPAVAVSAALLAILCLLRRRWRKRQRQWQSQHPFHSVSSPEATSTRTTSTIPVIAHDRFEDSTPQESKCYAGNAASQESLHCVETRSTESQHHGQRDVQPPSIIMPCSHSGKDLTDAGVRSVAEWHRWEIPSARIDWAEPWQVLGRGSFGVVCAVQCGSTPMAAKRMDVRGGEAGRRELDELLLREFRAMARVCHPNLVKIFGVVVDDPSYVCLLMERADGGSLRELLQGSSDSMIKQPMAQLSIAHDMASALAYLHERRPRPMLHHDIKSANVLLFKEQGRHWLTAKLGDFGLATGISRTTYGEISATRVGGGTITYKAPEAFDRQYITASDVYSFAIVCWELLTGDKPWGCDSNGQVYTEAQIMMSVVGRGERPPLPEYEDDLRTECFSASAILAAIVRRAWAQTPQERPTATQLRRELLCGLQREVEVQSGTVPNACVVHLEPSTHASANVGVGAGVHIDLSAGASVTVSVDASADLLPLSIPCRSPTNAYDVFISLQPGEVDAEATQLARALEARRLRVYVATQALSCSSPVDSAYEALSSAKLVVLMAGQAYGQRTATGFGSYEQLQFVMDEGSPTFLIKMCEVWSAPHVRGRLGARTMVSCLRCWNTHLSSQPIVLSCHTSALALDSTINGCQISICQAIW